MEKVKEEHAEEVRKWKATVDEKTKETDAFTSVWKDLSVWYKTRDADLPTKN
jgi:hypothetical protein